MNPWKEVTDGYFSFEDDSWTLYLRLDDAGALLEVYKGTILKTTSGWGPAVLTRTGGREWCMKQAIKVLEAEKKKGS
jgi:hypothetical protein